MVVVQDFLFTLAQVGGADTEVDTPLKKFLWFGLVPIGLIVLIFGGGLMLRRAETRDRLERERLRKPVEPKSDQLPTGHVE